MNCTQALEQLLDADLVPSARTGSPDAGRALAEHLGSCERCARAATALGAGTVALAQAVARERASAPRTRAARQVIGRSAPRTAFASALLITVSLVAWRTVLLELRRAASTVATAGPAVAPTALPSPAPASASAAPVVATRTRPGAANASTSARASATVEATSHSSVAARVEPAFFVAEPVRVAAVEATSFTLVNAANAVPVAPENRADAARAPEIIVTNRLGTHAMVSRTADPNIVVVWLSSEPNRRNP